MSVKSSELEFRPAMKCWKYVIQIGTKILRLLLHAVHSHLYQQILLTPTEYTQSGDCRFPVVHPIMMEKSALAGEGGGCTPTPFQPITITFKVAVYSPTERADTLPVCHLYLYMYSVLSPLGFYCNS